MKSSTTRNLVLLILAVATMAATAQTALQPQAAPQQPAPQPQNAPLQPSPQPAQPAPQQPSVSQPQSSPQQNVSSEGQALHILVGKSVVANVQAPITRVLSSNPSVIETLATSPTEIVVEGRAAGASSLFLWYHTSLPQLLVVLVE